MKVNNFTNMSQKKSHKIVINVALWKIRSFKEYKNANNAKNATVYNLLHKDI